MGQGGWGQIRKGLRLLHGPMAEARSRDRLVMSDKKPDQKEQKTLVPQTASSPGAKIRWRPGAGEPRSP